MILQDPLGADNKSVVWNPVLKSIFRLYQKLKDFGFTYFERKVSIIDIEEKNSHV